MSLELIRTFLFLVTGGFLLFLAVTILRDSYANRLNRICGFMLLFAGLGPIFYGLGGILDQTILNQQDFEQSFLYNITFIWEFFFPLLLLFSWVFPEDRYKHFRHPRLRYLIFIPYILHLVIVFFFNDIVNMMESLRIETVGEGFSSLILKPFSTLVTWLTYLFSFFMSYHVNIFGFVNFIYIIVALYFLETSRAVVANPRLKTQTQVVLWALRISLGIYVIAHLGTEILSYSMSDLLSSGLMLLSLLSGTALFIYATIRYQFLDVRLAFRQSFIYSLTSALLVGLYIVLVVQSRKFLGPIFGEESDIISYAFIILILLMFQPINTWIDEFTRSLFIRTRTDHRNVLERFSKQVISMFDPVKLRNTIEETLKTTLLVERLYFILYDDSVGEYVIVTSTDNPKRVIIKRDDLLLRGINMLDKPTFWHTLGNYQQNSQLAANLESLNTKLVLPMKDSEHLLGFLALSNKAAGYKYSTEDLNLLGVLSNQMVTALTIARLYVDSLERIRLEEEVSMARQIQLDLLPKRPPSLECLTISAHSTPSRTVGGDFFDFIKAGENRLGICIADASGKGMPAALMIAQTQAILKSEITNGNAISQVIENINTHLVASSSSEKYVTLFYGEINTETGDFEFANAGHNYPILMRSDGELVLLETGGPIVGALPMMKYQSESVKLHKDDILFFFTDGLSEAMDKDEREYTEDRIRLFIQEHRQDTPDHIIDSILKDVRAHDPTYPPRDDTTIIALKVLNNFKVAYEQVQ